MEGEGGEIKSQTEVEKNVVHTLQSDYGEVEVTVSGDLQTQPVVLTVHDVGLNHHLCFASLFSPDISESPTIFSRFASVHIDLPGQQFEASELTEPILKMEDLVEIIDDVRSHFRIDKFIGFGVGAGAYLLASYAAKHRDRVIALILVSGCCQQVGWGEWAENMTSGIGLWISGSFTKNTLTRRYFSQYSDPELTGFYELELDRLHAGNVAKFVNGFAKRSDISEELKKIKVPVLVLFGESATTQEETGAMREFMGTGNTEFVGIPRMGHLLTEECPEEILEPISLFCNSLGYFVQTKKFAKRKMQPFKPAK